MIKSKYFVIAIAMMVLTLLVIGKWATPVQASTANIITPTSTPITGPNSQGEPISAKQQEELKVIIQSYFEIRYQALSVLQPDGFQLNDFDDLVSDRSDSKAFLDAELGKLAVEIKHARLNHLRYVDYKYSLDFNNFEIDSSSKMATVSVIEEHEVIEEISVELNRENPFVSRRYNLEHTIILRVEQGQWKIVSDNYTDYLWRMLRQTEISTDEILRTMKATSRPAPQSVNTITEFTCDLPVNASTHPYYREGAVNYAIDHVNQYNPNYPDYNSGDDALPWGDCTNFVSQAIYEGGNASMAIPSSLPQPSTDGQVGWYLLNDLQRASAWSDVGKLHEFILDPLATPSAGWTEGPEGCDATIFDLMVGDVIQYDWTGDGFWDHAVIVVYIIDGIPYVATHSPDDIRPYINFAPFDPNKSQFRFIHIEQSDGNPPIKTQITSSADDWGPNPLASCASIPTWNEIYFGACPSGGPITSGFRFNNIQVPQGAQLKYAYISFTVDGPYGLTSSPPATPPYPVAPISVNIYEQNHSGTVVTWGIRGDQSIDYDTWDWKDRRTTPDLQTIIEAAISGGWQSGNSLSIMFTNNGENNVRRVMAYDRLDDGPLLGYLPARLIAAYSSGDETTLPPNVVSITRTSPDPTNGTSVGFTVTFSESVTDVDTSDFTPNATGITGATVTSVSGSGSVYTVTVNTGTGNGTIRLDLIDNDSILDATLNPLGGVGAGNGNFTTGQVYTVDKVPPSVISSIRANPNPTNLSSVNFTVTFSEAVTGVDIADFTLFVTGGTGTSVSSVSGSGSVYTVTVNTGFIYDGTIRLDVTDNDTILDAGLSPLGGSGTGNGNFTAGEVYTVDKIITLNLKSIGVNDGWVLESTETSGIGGSLNNTTTTFILGDDAANKQYRAILHFDTSSLPDWVVVTSATIKIQQQGQVGSNPFNVLGGLSVDIRNPYFSSTVGLANNDFQAAASQASVATFNETPAGAWYSAVLNAAGISNINLTGTTQFRLRFTTDDNNDLGADYFTFSSGDAGAANRPQLIIKYFIPLD